MDLERSDTAPDYDYIEQVIYQRLTFGMVIKALGIQEIVEAAYTEAMKERMSNDDRTLLRKFTTVIMVGFGWPVYIK